MKIRNPAVCAAILVIGLVVTPLSAQKDAAFVRSLATKETATMGDGMVLVAMMLGSKSTDAGKARSYLLTRKIVDQNAKTGDSLTKGNLALMIMRAKKWGGGIFYSIFGSGRYAYRELVFRRIMQPAGGDAMSLSGGEALAIVSRAAGQAKLKLE